VSNSVPASVNQAEPIATSAQVRPQAFTRRVPARKIVASWEFARGLEEVRNGLPFNPDNDEWNYERGRCFGFIAPLDMPLRIGRALNPKALKLAAAAFKRRFLI
jgi:hypothetical protein